MCPYQAFAMEVYGAEWMANCLKMVKLTQTSLLFYFSLDEHSCLLILPLLLNFCSLWAGPL